MNISPVRKAAAVYKKIRGSLFFAENGVVAARNRRTLSFLGQAEKFTFSVPFPAAETAGFCRFFFTKEKKNAIITVDYHRKGAV